MIQMIIIQLYIILYIQNQYFICMIMRNMQEESASPLDAAISGRNDSKWWNRSTAAGPVGRQLAAYEKLSSLQFMSRLIISSRGRLLRLPQLAVHAKTLLLTASGEIDQDCWQLRPVADFSGYHSLQVKQTLAADSFWWGFSAACRGWLLWM